VSGGVALAADLPGGAALRTLVISDVHGNLAALEAVLAQPHDALVCLGDLVGYGPEPGACVRRIRAEAALVLQGNHDRALGEGVPPGCSPRFEWLARALDPVGRAQLDPEERAWLAGLPRTAVQEYDGRRCLLVHATPDEPLYRYLGLDARAWADEVAGLDVDAVLVGHTHVQFELRAAGRRVINPGSVGQPKDGDPQAACALLENGAVRFARVAYDVERTTAVLARTGADPAAVAALSDLLRTGRVPP
jgi:predicted phosphodiesterase